MKITENLTPFSPEELFSYANRENNKKRAGLIVNHLQAKHIPADPDKTVSLFNMLAERIKNSSENEKILVIGFAETATAIGAAVSVYLENCTYIHTSREAIDPELRVADFSEEHSHATEQNLFSANGKDIFRGITKIIFAEDELTTGKTILNFINVIKNITDEGCRFGAASIINGMGPENMELYRSLGIELYYLIKLDNSLPALNTEMTIDQLPDVIPSSDGKPDIIHADYNCNPRLGVSADEYYQICRNAAEQSYEQLRSMLSGCKTVDVIGTEECMYPAIILAAYLKEKGFDTTSHSTTRSPIVPSDKANYPLVSRCRLKSFYDRERTTFIYNMYDCDMTILITDADSPDDITLSEFASVMRSEKKAAVLLKNGGLR